MVGITGGGATAQDCVPRIGAHAMSSISRSFEIIAAIIS